MLTSESVEKPVADKNFTLLTRGKINSSFRMHPGAVPLHENCSAPPSTRYTDDTEEPLPKRSRLEDVSLRAKHPSQFSADNPQPDSELLDKEDQDVVVAPVDGVLVNEASEDLPAADARAGVEVDVSGSAFLTVTMPDAQTEDQAVRIAQRYGRAFARQVPVRRGAGVVNPAVRAEVVDDDEAEEAPAAEPAAEATPAEAASSKNKVVRRTKQESQDWVSKEGLYGGAVSLGEADEVSRAQADADIAAETVPTPAQSGRPRAHKRPVPCYVCKTPYKVLHHFYDRMCPTCADMNYKKRFQQASMKIQRFVQEAGQHVAVQRVCLVTGARVKIGYEIALKLLRSGAFVIATSRFPHDTALRLYREPDFEQWKDSVHVYGVDFRVISAVEMFCSHVLRAYPRLDLIMNNAAQTIRRPPQFYRHLVEREAAPLETLPVECRHLVQDFLPADLRASAQASVSAMLTDMGVAPAVLALEHKADDTAAPAPAASAPAATSASAPATDGPKVEVEEVVDGAMADGEAAGPNVEHPQDPNQALIPIKDFTPSSAVSVFESASDRSTRLVTMLSLPHAAAVKPAFLSQIPLVAGDEDKPEDAHLFPVGVYDKDDQQVDLRPKQTWVMQASEVSTVELAEVQFVNQMAPFIINTKLKPLMRRSGDPSWIINVSSMEGKFRGFKDTTHPHTNMAKAALNQFTHTSAKDYAADRIFMNAVDTGWVTEELPHAIAVHKAKIGFAPPLDEIDGAARCLDPVFTSLLTGVYEYGKFFKDYAEGHW
jgi:NAD(P)-dependent dehydrogenase (short-subunit alcohol dehydrogenase family)